jgi:hypothetical protein
MAKRPISDEELDSIESEFMTRDIISVIVNDIRKREEVKIPEKKSKKALVAVDEYANRFPDDKCGVVDALHAALGLINKLDGDECLLYRLGGEHGFCSSGCPFGKDNPGHCTLRGTASKCKEAVDRYNGIIMEIHRRSQAAYAAKEHTTNTLHFPIPALDMNGTPISKRKRRVRRMV